MVFYAILLLCLATALGVSLVAFGILKQRSSLKAGLSHGFIALTGFGFLGAQIMNGPINKANNVAALLLALAIIGGLMLLALHEKDRPPPIVLVALHATAAISGLIVLVLGY